MNDKHTPFWLLTIAVFIVLIVPVLIQDGMFMDGALYTCVAKNLANGLGTFWNPIFSETWNKAGVSSFHEHPPLIFGIQAFFFKLLGNSIYVERFYSFLTACGTAYLIHKIWNLLTFGGERLGKLSWLPILFWITIPVAFWSFQNNVQENTMGIFTLLSVYFSLKAIYRNQYVFLSLLLSGICIFLASFCKGISGFFPIGVIGLYWLISRELSFFKMLGYTLVLILIPTIIYLLLCTNATAYESLSFYIEKRLLTRIDSAPTVDSRFYIVERLFMELLPVIISSGLLLATFKYKQIKQEIDKFYRHKIILLLLIGCSGSIPLVLTLVQKGFYMAHSLPFFAIGFALLVAPGLSSLIERINIEKQSFKLFRGTMFGLLGAVLLFSFLQKGKTSRNADLLHDVYLMGEQIPPYSIITIDKKMWENWDLQCALIRHYNISVDRSATAHDFYLIEKKLDKKPLDKFEKITLKTKRYNLYKSVH